MGFTTKDATTERAVRGTDVERAESERERRDRWTDMTEKRESIWRVSLQYSPGFPPLLGPWLSSGTVR
jgi:hypothetical protein